MGTLQLTPPNCVMNSEVLIWRLRDKSIPVWPVERDLFSAKRVQCSWSGPHAIAKGDDCSLSDPDLQSGCSQPVNFCVPRACGNMQRKLFLSLNCMLLQKGTVQLFVPCGAQKGPRAEGWHRGLLLLEQ